MENPATSWTDYLNRAADYRLASNHRGSEFRMNGQVQLPFGPNQLLFGNSSGVLARAIENWKMSWTYNVFSGGPQSLVTATGGFTPNGLNSLYNNGVPDVVGPWSFKSGDVIWGQDIGAATLGGTYFGKVGTYQVVPDPQCAAGGLLDTTDAMGYNVRTALTTCPMHAIADSSGQIVLQNPRPGHRGTLGQRSVMGPGSWTLDSSLSKNFRITESKQVQIRFDATNVLNHANPSTPEFNINDADFGTINGKGDQHRSFQGQLRFIF
jgi:hypothetical protein